MFNLTEFRSVYAHWPDGDEPALSSRFSTWDIAHYLKLSEQGYEAGSHSCAFYPLWPAAIRVGTILMGGRPVLACMLLANALSVVAFWLFYQLVERRHGAALARSALILMLAFPGALFFSFGYTESLYLVILLVLFHALETDRYSWLCVTAFLLPLARPVGVFILLPLAWHFYERHGFFGLRLPMCRPLNGPTLQMASVMEGRMSTPDPKPFRDKFMPWLLVLVPLLGYAAYFGLMHLWTGNAIEGFEAQKAYPNSPSIKNAFDMPGFLHALGNIGSLDGMMDSFLDRFFFVLFLVLLPLVYRLDKTWFFYVLPAGLVPAMTSWFMSYRRYIMVLFPIFILLAQLLAKSKSRWVFWYYVIILAAMQAWAIKQFVNFNWAG